MNYCGHCNKQDHESNLLFKDQKGWFCPLCFEMLYTHNPEDGRYECKCGRWDYHDLRTCRKKYGDNWKCPYCHLVPSWIYNENDECKSALHSPDNVNHPAHYKGKGIEVIEVIEAFDLNYNMGNAIKYILRAGKKAGDDDGLKKAVWYLEREIENRYKVPEKTL